MQFQSTKKIKLLQQQKTASFLKTSIQTATISQKNTTRKNLFLNICSNK